MIYFLLFFFQQLLFQNENIKEKEIIQELLKLNSAGVSEEIMIDYVENYKKKYQISAEDLILLKEKNVPENVIKKLLQFQSFQLEEKKENVFPKEFKTLVLKKGFLKKDRIGTIAIREERVEWLDIKDPSSSFSFRIDNIRSIFLKCEPKAEKPFCYEITFSNFQGKDYSFSDFNWKSGENKQIISLYNFFKENFKNIIYGETITAR